MTRECAHVLTVAGKGPHFQSPGHALFHRVSRPELRKTSAGMRFLTALVLLLQPADGLLLSAATRAPVARSAGLALSPLAVPRSSIIHMGRVCAP